MKQIIIILFLFSFFLCKAQQDSLSPKGSPSIQCVGRFSQNQVKLRWSCLDYYHWDLGNKYGYMIEKITLGRKGELLNYPIFQRWRLTPFVSKDSADCISHILSNDYSALMAQAVFGENFEVHVSNSPIMRVSRQAEENLMRFSLFSLAADKSFEAACFGNLGWIDTAVSQDDMCLYKIYICADSLQDFSQDTAIYFFSADIQEVLPLEAPLLAKVDGNRVRLEWADFPTHYVSYYVERGQDLNFFERINTVPITNIASSTSSNLSYTDSSPSVSTFYYYRIIGVDLFGEENVCSSIVQAKFKESLGKNPPRIVAVEEATQKIRMKWFYSPEDQALVECFEITNKSSYYGKEELVAVNINKKRRELEIDPRHLHPSNYFTVKVINLEGGKIASEPYFFQQADSTPPLSPMDLSSSVDSVSGKLILSWTPNSESDILGYRVYKSNSAKGEFFQMTSEELTAAFFEDTIPLNVAQSFFYKVKALDFRGNESAFSLVHEVKSIVPPYLEPPLFFDCHRNSKAAVLHWYYSQTSAITHHKLFYKYEAEEWKEVKIFYPKIGKIKDSLVFDFPPLTATYSFRLCAYSINGDSVDAPFQYQTTFKRNVQPPSFHIEAQRSENGILIYWNNKETSKVKNVFIYRESLSEPMRLLAVLSQENLKNLEKISYYFDKDVKMNTIYQYLLRVEGEGGEWSDYSEKEEVVY